MIGGIIINVNLYGSSARKAVAAFAHAYALITIKLELPVSIKYAPWMGNDYFAWRRAMTVERRELERTLGDIYKSQPPDVAKVAGNFNGGYNDQIANAIAHDYAMAFIKHSGLPNG